MPTYQATLFQQKGLNLQSLDMKGINKDLLQWYHPRTLHVVGRRLLYGIYLDSTPIGAIGAQGVSSLIMRSVWQELFGPEPKTPENKARYYKGVMVVSIFGISKDKEFLSERSLKLFMERAGRDYKNKYKDDLLALVMISGEYWKDMACIKNGWKWLGLSKGSMKTVHGIGKNDSDPSKFTMKTTSQNNIYFLNLTKGDTNAEAN